MERTRLDVYEKLPSGMEKYLAEHGWNFSKKLCEYAVSKMKDRNGNKIHPYDKDQVVFVLLGPQYKHIWVKGEYTLPHLGQIHPCCPNNPLLKFTSFILISAQ